MPTQQGSLTLLNDPVAQQLLQSTNPANLAYNWRDGTPRVVPIWFYWNGQELVFGSPTAAPKVKVMNNAKVAVTIDGITWPYKVLLIRGTAKMSIVDGVVPEYATAAERYFGEQGGKDWVKQVQGMTSQMARIVVKPEWVGIMDFEKRFPSAIEAAMGI
jgi:Pyridoxamine 5'-phosphate oxidase